MKKPNAYGDGMTDIHEAEIETGAALRKSISLVQELNDSIAKAATALAELKRAIESLEPVESGVCEHCGTAVCPHILGYLSAMS